MTGPLFTAKELEAWAERKRDAKVPCVGDDHMSVYRRSTEVRDAFKRAMTKRLRARPDAITKFLLVAIHEQGTEPLIWDDLFMGRMTDRIEAADTPETRRHLHSVLSGLKHVPRSWAKSATTRFFRGSGPQSKPPWSSKPGAGVLSKDFGWTTRTAQWFVGLFYSAPLDDLFFADDSPDPYGEEGHEIREKGGNRFAATRKERDDEFIDTLRALLDEQGLGDMPTPKTPQPKPRTPKTWKVGDKITSRNLRDLPKDAHVQWRVVEYEMGYGSKPAWSAKHRLYEFVFEERPATGQIIMRPVMQGNAFGTREFQSSNLYKGGLWRNEVEATYLGQWEGETLDVEIAQSGWKPVSTKKVKMQTIRVTDDNGRYLRTDYVRAD